MKKIIVISCCLVMMTSLQAQQVQPVDLMNKKFTIHLDPSSTNGWIKFRKEAPYHADKLFTEQPELLGLRTGDELRIFKTNTDAAGNLHYKYAQYYNGVRVEGIEQYTHERNGRLHLANGDFVQGLNMNVNPSVSNEQAIETALAAYPAEIYSWQDERAEADFKQKKKDDNASLYPAPELLIVKIDPKGDKVADNYVLAYRMYVFAKKPYIAETVYIDAQTGNIIRTKSLDINCTSTTVETTFNGDQTVYTDFRTEDCDFDDETTTAYFTIDDCNPDTEIKSYFSESYGDLFYGEDWFFCDSDNSWLDYLGSYKMVLTTLWSVKRAYTYYYNVHGHESFDGSDGLIDAFSNRTYFDDDDNPHCRNANYTNIVDNLNFGAGDDCDPGTTDDYNTLDIVGHEYTHGVIEYAHFDALDYSEESGALNESFADIFGEIIENYVEGGLLSWQMAEDRGYIRSFEDPNLRDDPDTYLGDYWADLDGDDNGGVHTNSGVQNHMFYLLTDGGSGVNDHGIEYIVEGIGLDHARDIAWHAMMNYLDSDDGYITARNAWIQSAIDLFGSCSQEVISVGQAFQAAGVTEYTSYDIASVCGTYALTGFADATYGIENSSILFGEFFTDCTTTISSGAVVTFESGYYINFHPGFTATSGCTFTAWIDECEVSDYDAGDLKYADDITEENETTVMADVVHLFPNPADQEITIDLKLSGDADVSISVVDLSGREIAKWMESRQTGSDELFTFPVSGFASGIYICLISVDGVVTTDKFVVEH